MAALPRKSDCVSACNFGSDSVLVQMGAVERQKAEHQTRDWTLGRVLLRRVQAGAECSQTLEARSTTYRSAEDLGCTNIESEPIFNAD
jgi:hypothetical protein